jgi:hypothetical protein
MLPKSPVALCVAFVTAMAVSLAVDAIAQPAQSQPAAADVTPDTWPKTLSLGTTKYTIYQPQLETWDGGGLTGRAAVSVGEDNAAPTFGVINVTAVT